jgi:hypothetical protein
LFWSRERFSTIFRKFELVLKQFFNVFEFLKNFLWCPARPWHLWRQVHRGLDFGRVLAGKSVIFGEDKMAPVTSCHIKGHFCLQIPAYFTLLRLVSFGNYNSMDGENDSVLKRKWCAVYIVNMLFVVKDGQKFRYIADAVLVYKTFTSNSNWTIWQRNQCVEANQVRQFKGQFTF